MIRLSRKRKQNPPPLVLGGDDSRGAVVLPLGPNTPHLGIMGTTGSGKSSAIKRLALQIALRRSWGERTVIIGAIDELLPYFYCGSRTSWGWKDVLLNATDRRATATSPLAWIRRESAYLTSDAHRVARNMVTRKDEGEAGAWAGHTRNLLTWVLVRLVEMKATNAELISLLTQPQRDSDLRALCEGTPAASHWAPGNERAHGGAMFVLSEYMAPFATLDPQAGVDSFKFRDWLTDPQYAGSWLWLGVPEDQLELMRSLIAAMAAEIMAATLTLQASRTRRIYVLGDEYAALGLIPSTESLLARGRNYGLQAILGFQLLPQLEKIYGHEGARVLLGNCRTTVVMAQSEINTARYCADLIGREQIVREIESESRSRTTGSEGGKGTQIGSSRSEQYATEHVVTPEDLLALPERYAYVRRAGRSRVALVRVPLVNQLPRIAKTFVPTLDAPQREKAALGARNAWPKPGPDSAADGGGRALDDF